MEDADEKIFGGILIDFLLSGNERNEGFNEMVIIFNRWWEY